MDYEKKYKEALERAKQKYAMFNGMKQGDVLEDVFPELKESEDESLRKAIHIYLDWLDGRKDYAPKGEYSIRDMIAWLEKQVSVDEEKVLIGARKDVALSIMNFLDRNTLGMCLSNMECADLESAVVDSDWSKVYNYMKKKLEKQGGQKPAWSEEDKYLLDETIKHLEALIRITKKQGSAYSDEIQYYQRDIDWLKSLRPQSAWKPSEEQIEALSKMFYIGDEHVVEVVSSLYKDLRKLREE